MIVFFLSIALVIISIPFFRFLWKIKKARIEKENEKAAEKAQRASVSQPAQTASEDDLKQQDSDKDAKIAELNMMRAALKEAKVRGYQLFGETTLREKYAELMERKAAAGKGE